MKEFKHHKTRTMLILFTILAFGCNKEDCEEIRKENCSVTFELNPVCGCNGVTYSNPSTAECNNINDYTMGECD
ncbi:hypothetical protein [Flagellimonas sp.]|jgi:hypothetical protein|uniref:hypothetical protein n=2 Tax=Flagellimonas sp. TaxID=2058762 RepID=UPI003BADA463